MPKNNNVLDDAEIDFESLEKAISSLRAASISPPNNDLERDGIIQRFEYTFELCWKFIRRYLLTVGRKELSHSPKPLFRDAFEEGLITDVKIWFDYLEARNTTSHIYDSRKADKIYKIAITFPPYAERLLGEMKGKIQKWISTKKN